MYPEKIIFSGFRSNFMIARDIQKMGFAPYGKPDNTVIKKDSAFSKGAIIVFVLTYAVFSIANFIAISSRSVLERRNYIPGYTEITALTVLLIIFSSIKYFAFLQNLIVKRKRNFAEVKHIFTVMIEVIGLILAVFVTQLWRQESLNMIFGIPQLVGIICFALIFVMPVIRASYLSSK